MGFAREIKKQMVRQLAGELQGSPTCVLVDTRGMKATQAAELRRTLRKRGARMRHLKNSIARFAFQEAGLKELGENLDGMNAVVFGEDPVAIAKCLYGFLEAHKGIRIRRGLMDGRSVSSTEIQELSRLPSTEEIQATLLGTFQAPAAQFVRTLQEVPGTFVRTLEAVRKGKETGGG